MSVFPTKSSNANYVVPFKLSLRELGDIFRASEHSSCTPDDCLDRSGVVNKEITDKDLVHPAQ